MCYLKAWLPDSAVKDPSTHHLHWNQFHLCNMQGGSHCNDPERKELKSSQHQFAMNACDGVSAVQLSETWLSHLVQSHISQSFPPSCVIKWIQCSCALTSSVSSWSAQLESGSASLQCSHKSALACVWPSCTHRDRRTQQIHENTQCGRLSQKLNLHVLAQGASLHRQTAASIRKSGLTEDNAG